MFSIQELGRSSQIVPPFLPCLLQQLTERLALCLPLSTDGDTKMCSDTVLSPRAYQVSARNCFCENACTWGCCSKCPLPAALGWNQANSAKPEAEEKLYSPSAFR